VTWHRPVFGSVMDMKKNWKVIFPFEKKVGPAILSSTLRLRFLPVVNVAANQ
jgi:hypothetical protein